MPDKIIIFWAVWTFFVSFFHDSSLGSGPKYISGVIVNILGAYFISRSWTRSLEDANEIFKILIILLVPLAFCMAIESILKHNPFSLLGANSAPAYRDGEPRASGPFRHAILAGTFGAVCLPIAILYFRKSKALSIIGIISIATIVVASNSSGPIATLLASITGLLFWSFRQHIKKAIVALIFLYIAYQAYTGIPGYYIITKFNPTGSSQSRFRAMLIESAIKHFDEWWLFGTDHTRHWMYSGVSFSENHTDLTNYFIAFGVVSGLPALLALLFMFITRMRELYNATYTVNKETADTCWSIWSILFAYLVTSISVSYFDQSLILLWTILGLAPMNFSKLPDQLTNNNQNQQNR